MQRHFHTDVSTKTSSDYARTAMTLQRLRFADVRDVIWATALPQRRLYKYVNFTTTSQLCFGWSTGRRHSYDFFTTTLSATDQRRLRRRQRRRRHLRRRRLRRQQRRRVAMHNSIKSLDELIFQIGNVKVAVVAVVVVTASSCFL